jgi:putative redox protein
MAKHTVRLEWLRENLFLLRDRRKHTLVMAPFPQGVNGSDLLPLSLIGCCAWDIMHLVKEKGVQVSGLEVSAESEQDDQPPWQFRRILVHYRFRGSDLIEEDLRHLVQLGENQYCSLYATLRNCVEIITEVEIMPEVEVV